MKKVKLLMIGLLAMTVVACGSSDKTSIELKKKEFVIEYGNPASEDAKDYVKADKDVLKETGISFKDVKYEKREEDGKDIKFLEVGTYKATAVYKDETLDFKIVVKDTTAPEFVDFKDKIEIEQDSTEDLSTKFTATDLSDVTITVDVEKIDSSKAGEYKTTVTAKDKYDNETTKDVTIVVKEKESADQSTDQQTDQGTQNVSGDTSGGSTSGNNGSSTTGTGGSNNSGSGSSGSTTPSTPTPTPARPQVAAGTCEPNNGRFGSVGNSGMVCNGLDAARAWGNSYADGLDDATYMQLNNFVEWTVYDDQGERNDIWTVNIIMK